MRPEKVIRKNFLRNFLLLLLCVFFAGTAVSAVVFYLNIHKPLDTHYGAILAIISEIRESLILTTIKINLVFFVLITAGVGLLALLYTHRIAGPLYRIRQCTKSISEGRLDTEINLRSKDAINEFADSLQKMTKTYSGKIASLTSEIHELNNAVSELQTLSGTGKDPEEALKKITAHDNRIKEILNTIKC